MAAVLTREPEVGQIRAEVEQSLDRAMAALIRKVDELERRERDCGADGLDEHDIDEVGEVAALAWRIEDAREALAGGA